MRTWRCTFAILCLSLMGVKDGICQPKNGTVKQYSYDVIVKRDAGKTAILDGLKIQKLLMLVSENTIDNRGNIFFSAMTDHGTALFRNKKAIVYSGKVFRAPSGGLIEVEGYYGCKFNNNGDVLYFAKRKSGPDICVLNETVVCAPPGENNVSKWYQGIVGYPMIGGAGFDKQGNYVVDVRYQKRVKVQVSMSDAPDEGNLGNSAPVEPQVEIVGGYLVRGVFKENDPEMLDYAPYKDTSITGIKLEVFSKQMFGSTGGGSRDGDIYDMGNGAAFWKGLDCLRNSRGQIGLIFSQRCLRSTTDDVSGPEKKDYPEAVVLATPVGLKPLPTEPKFSDVLSSDFRAKTGN